MTNAEKFKQLFGIYATELWAMPEEKFLEWLNAEALEKQEQDKSCETCKHENLTLLQSPCRDCYRSTSMFEDYYEPYTEEES